MSALGDIRRALALQLTTQLADVYVYNHVDDNPSAPCVMIMVPDLIDLRESLTAGTKRYVMPLQLRVQRVDDEGAEDKLDDLIDDVIAAVLYSPTIGGTVDSVDPMMVDTFGLMQQGDERLYLACELHLELLVTS